MTTAHESAIFLTSEQESASRNVRTWVTVSFVLFVLNLVAYVGFMTTGGVFFTISDAAALFFGASMIPVVIGLDTMFSHEQPSLSRRTKWVGLTAMTLIAAGSLVILTSEVSHEFVPAGGGLTGQIIGFALFGFWLLMIGILAGRTTMFSRRTEWAAKGVAAGFLFGSLGSPFGPDNFVVYIGATVGLVSYLVWMISTRIDLNS
jgi:hypothetical protein